MTPAARLVLLHPSVNDAACWSVDADLARFVAWRQAVVYSRDEGAQPTAAALLAAIDGPMDLAAVGDSCGVALEALGRDPDRVRSALLVNPQDADGEEGTTGDTGARLAAWFTPFAVRNASAGVRYVEALMRSSPERFARPPARIPRTGWSDIGQPVTLVLGANGAESSLATALHRAIPRSRVEIVPGRVLAHLEFPDAFMSAIYHHLTWARTAERCEDPLPFSPLGSMGEWHGSAGAAPR